MMRRYGGRRISRPVPTPLGSCPNRDQAVARYAVKLSKGQQGRAAPVVWRPYCPENRHPSARHHPSCHRAIGTLRHADPPWPHPAPAALRRTRKGCRHLVHTSSDHRSAVDGARKGGRDADGRPEGRGGPAHPSGEIDEEPLT